MDVSPDMLREALHPLQEHALLIHPQLICANITEVSFKDESFDLVYSIGVLGEFLPFDSYVCEKIARMLKTKGKFVFTVVSNESPQTTSLKRRAAERLLPFLLVRLRLVIKARLRALSLSENELMSVMNKARLYRHTMKRRQSPTSGRIHFVCTAYKD